MSRIIIDARELRTSSGRYVERLLYYLQDIDRKNDYLVLLAPKDIAGWQPHNPRFKAIACPHKEFTFDEQIGLRKQIGALQADLVHFAFAQQPVWYRGKTVTTIHDLTTLRFDNPDKNPVVFKLKQRVYAYVIRRAVRKAEHVVTGSQFVKEDVMRFAGVPDSHITVTHEAADAITEPALALPALDGKQFLMYVGRPTPHKNLERLIEAFVLLKAQHPHLRLVLAGKKDANYRRIEAAAQKHGIKGVVFTDFISEGELRWLYEHCAAYVFPSLSEGFGLPGLEAMTHNAPVVSSNATCLPEIYGEAAHYFDPLDTGAMADAINEILTDEQLRSRLIVAGRTQAATYSWQRMAEQTLATYERALS
jgi:glycosyltransferase involved in cell wall biosynthesis